MFRFYEELNDFLPKDKKKRDFSYSFGGTPSIKDVIESMGIPHTEIDLILVNGNSVNFSYRLQSNDRISVYPVFESLDISPVMHLHPKPLRISRFILDVQLGKLARALRMLGFDTLYRNDYQDFEIIDTAINTKRIILTRDRGILKHKSITHGYWVRNTSVNKQVEEIVRRFDLKNQIQPLTRCLLCNEPIKSIKKGTIINRLPPGTAKQFDTFYHCTHCDKIYWPGSHYQRMRKKIDTILFHLY